MTIGFTLIFVQVTSVSIVPIRRTQTFRYQLYLNSFIMDPGLEGIQKLKLFIITYSSTVDLIIRIAVFGLFYVSVGILISYLTEESVSVLKLKWL
jgi:hypothetical protein